MAWTAEQRQVFRSLIKVMALNAQRTLEPDQIAMYEASCCQHDFDKVIEAVKKAVQKGGWYTVEKIEQEIGVVRIQYVPPPTIDTQALLDQVLGRESKTLKAQPLTEDVETGFWIFRYKTPPGMQDKEINAWMQDHVQRLMMKGWHIVGEEIKPPQQGYDEVLVNQGSNSFMQKRECWIWNIPAIRDEVSS